MMKSRRTAMKKAGCILMALLLMFGGVPVSVHAEGEAASGEAEYKKIVGMSDIVPSNWYDETDPYGYGLYEDFIMNPQQELLVYRYNGVADQKIYSYDTLKAENTGYPLSGAKSTDEYNVTRADTLSYARTVAFDPTGSGRKDHIAVIGVYAGEAFSQAKPTHIYMYVMDKDGHSSGQIDLGVAKWMSIETELNNDKMWEFNSSNFLGITAGDYNGNEKESLVVWGCASKPFLQQVNVTSSNGNISLSVMGANGYQAREKESSPEAGGLTHPLYIDSNDQYVDNRLHLALDSGDFNGDGVDDLAVLSYVDRVTKGEQDKWGYYYIPHYAVSYGVKGSSKSITAGENADKGIYVQDTWEGNSHIAPLAAGLAVGDIDGDGKDEAVISGIYHEVSGSYWYNDGSQKPVADAYEDVDSTKLVTAIYRGGSRLMFDKATSANGWTDGETTRGGYFVDAGNATTGDQSYQQVGVKTVAINGPGKAELIFINGDLYSYNASAKRISAVYQPSWFQSADWHMGDWDNEETYIRSMATGNFDGNEHGYEQIAFVVAAAASDHVGHVTYSLGLIGGIYEDEDGNPRSEAASYYITKNLEDTDHYYPSIHSGKCTVDSCLNFELCAWDNDSDGGHVRYVGKDYEYTDPEVMAIIQAPPYFSELTDVTSGASTSYSITTSYSYEKSVGNSVSFGVNGVFEVDADFFELSLEAGYALDWSESFTRGLEQGKEYTFTADTDDKVIIYRTPVTIYMYQIECNGSWSDENQIMLTFPSAPAYQELTIPQYNAFAAYYNEQCRQLAEQANAERIAAGEAPIPEDRIPHLEAINDSWLGHEGDPLSYMNINSPQEGRVLLQDTAMSFVVGSGSTSFSYEQSHSYGSEETMAHGFNFDLSMIGGSKTVKGGVHVSLNYMREHSVSSSTSTGYGASCEIGNINKSQLAGAGIPESTAGEYSFQYQMVTWPSAVTTFLPDEEDLLDPELEDDEIKMVKAKVPIYGFALSNVRAATSPVTDLAADFDNDEEDNPIIRLTWTDPGTEKNPVGAFTLYQIQKDGTVSKIATLPAGTTEYLFENIDGRTEYQFVIRTKRTENAVGESLDSNIAYLYIDANAIYSIVLTDSNDEYDTYTVYHTDGTFEVITVKHGVGIADISLSASEGLVDTYTITCTDGSTFTFTVKNGRDGADGKSAYEIAVENGFEGTEAEWIASLVGNGIGINEIKCTGTSEDGLTDTYTIYYTDGSTAEFTVRNGKDGETGNGIAAIAKTEPPEATDPNVDTYVITMTNGDTFSFSVRNGRDGTDGKSAYELAVENGYTGTVLEWLAELKGDGVSLLSITSEAVDERTTAYTFNYSDGTSYTFEVKDGEKGEDGRGIVSFEKTTEGNIDTYTITYTDGTTSVLTVSNGKDGEQGEKGDKGDKGDTGEQGEKGDKGDTGAQGEKGDKGDTGAQGEKGEKGDPGAQGEKGDKGDTGATGAKGDKGAAGATGSKGATGATGAKGEKGDPGAPGPKGDKGDPGEKGADGKDGVDGKDGIDGRDGADGVGVADAKVQDGDLLIVLSNGEMINAGQVVAEAQPQRGLNGENGQNGQTPDTGKTSSVPWWIIYGLISWNTLLTGGVVALAVTVRKGAGKDNAKKKA